MSKVLVVEDSPAIRLLIVRRLEMDGHEVDEAPNGEDAIRILTETGTPDVLVIDETMPLVDGAELLTQARKLWPGLPVVVVSAKVSADSNPAMAHADARLRKPIDFDLLLRTVRELTESAPGPA